MKYVWQTVIFGLLLFVVAGTVFAQACTSDDPCVDISDLSQRTTCYETLSTSCRREKDTLSSQINYMNSQIQLINLRVTATKSKINTLLREIDDLENEVVRLEGILNTRLQLLAHRIPASYKRSSLTQFWLLLLSNNISDFISRVKYLRSIQTEDASIVFQVKATQNSYNESKTVREDKRAQLVQIQTELERQNASLARQTEEKNTLLAATQGNESRYQQLLEQARTQLAAISEFVAGAGGATILPHQEYRDGWGAYYNQRDSAWGNTTIGNSSETLKSVGCLITSVAMILTHYGRSATPSDIARVSSAFVPGTAYMYYQPWSVNGATVYRTSVTRSAIDSELASGNPVIVGVYSGPGHFVVLKSKSGDDYIMNDPFVENGHDISFNSHYSFAVITEVNTVRIN
jgi:peptidoglycan hydrolase CwlO-like protein